MMLARAGVALLLLVLAAVVAFGGSTGALAPHAWLELLVYGIATTELVRIVLGSAPEFSSRRRLSDFGASMARIASEGYVVAAFAIAGGLWVFPELGDASVAAYALISAVGLGLTGVGQSILSSAAAGEAQASGPESRAAARGLRLRRGLVTVLSAGPVLATLGLAGWTLLVQPAGPDFACPLLPNGVVPRSAALPEACQLQRFDRVVEVWVPGDRGPYTDLSSLREKAQRWPEFTEWTAVRDGALVTVRVPLVERGWTERLGRFAMATLLSAILLTTGLIILWNTRAAAAAPFLFFYAQVSVALIAALCAGSNENLHLGSAIATTLFPPTLVHLSLTFPRELPAYRRVRGLPLVYYAFGLLLIGLNVYGFYRAADIWMLVNGLIPIYSVAAWATVLLGCAFALRESASRLERLRARVLVMGTIGVAFVGAGLAGLGGTRETTSSFGLALLTIVFLPLPVAVAIVRYHLFDLRLRLRRLVSYLLYNATTATLVTLATLAVSGAAGASMPLGDGSLLFSAVLVFLLVTDPLRSWMLQRARDWLDAAGRRRRRASARCVQELSELRDADACARILAEAISEGVRASWVVVYLRTDDQGLRPAHALGEGAPLSVELAMRARQLTADDAVLHLARTELSQEPDLLPLRTAGVEVAVPLGSAAGRAGIVLLGERIEALPYSIEELEFLSTLAAQAAIAVDNARLARDLVDAERKAARGNIAVGLAHELGKPLRVIEDIASGLPERLGDPARALRDVGSIREISRDLIETVYGFVAEARRERQRRGAPLADVISRAVSSVERIHGPDRVSVSAAPDLPDVEGADELATVLTNLLDNALLASGPTDGVHVFATREGAEGLRVEVVDQGHGMDATTAARAFDLFFTTRQSSGGSGVGLALAREIVRQLKGSIELSSEPGKGTRACLRILAADHSQPDLADADRPEPKKAE
jgi:signal transduction histidine kinase